MKIVISIPTPLELLRSWRLPAAALLALAVALFAASGEPVSGSGNSTTEPDSTGDVGQYSSLALDSSGFPVVAYRDASGTDLKVLHCNDASCAAGGDSITSPETVDALYIAMVLDSSGFPVVSYLALAAGDLKVMHCNDVNCAGGNESLQSPDTGGTVGGFTSITLDASGFPVISYADSTNTAIKVMHCNDANCAGGDEAINTTDNDPGNATSITLDASGFPVVSYHDTTNGDLKVMHCNDANCAGGNESIISADTAGLVGTNSSIALDSSGRPVIAYYDLTNSLLKVMHCSDANCAGANESITTPDAASPLSRIILDSNGYPVLSLVSSTATLRVLHCNDVNCAGVDDSVTTPDASGTVLSFAQGTALDSFGRPVVSYYDGVNTSLKLLHCFDAACAGSKTPYQIAITNRGDYPLPKTCFGVRDTLLVVLFTVCDNDFQSAAEADAVCSGDGICDDEDPADGQVSVTVVAGSYYVDEVKPPFNHTGDPSTFGCVNTGADCALSFTNTPGTMPWYPWDVDGNGLVDLLNDIFAVAFHFGCEKGASGEVCP